MVDAIPQEKDFIFPSHAHSETNEARVIYVGVLREMHVLCSQNISPSVQQEMKDA